MTCSRVEELYNEIVNQWGREENLIATYAYKLKVRVFRPKIADLLYGRFVYGVGHEIR